MMQDDQRCPIWGTVAHVSPLDDTGSVHIESPRTGGKFIINSETLAKIQDLPENLLSFYPLEENEKVKLTDWLIAERKKGVESPLVTDDVIEYIKTQPEKPISERVKDFIINFPGEHSSMVDISMKMGADNLPEGGYPPYMLAYSSSLSSIALTPIIEHCHKNGLIEKIANSSILKIRLTVDGMLFAEDAVKEDKQSHQCFVAMWFDKSMTNIYQNAIKPAIEDAGYTPYRVDEDNHNNMIDNHIIAQIRQSHFMIADFTSEIDKPRGGVYYEAGFAHGLGKQVIWTCRKDVIDEKAIHFDIQQYNFITWNENDLKALYDGIYNSIGANIGYGEKKQNIYTSFQEDKPASS